jgi:phosphohistidine phosphatase
MNIIFIRHAEAVPIDLGTVDTDFERPLTEKGHRQTGRLADFLLRAQFPVDRLYFSPLVRARETAAGIASTLQIPMEAQVETERLALGTKREKFIKLLESIDVETSILVGHEPHFSKWTAWLIGSKRAQVDFDKASAAFIQIDGQKIEKGCGELKWLIAPKLLMPE